MPNVEGPRLWRDPEDELYREQAKRDAALKRILGGDHKSNVIVQSDLSKLPDTYDPTQRDQRVAEVLAKHRRPRTP